MPWSGNSVKPIDFDDLEKRGVVTKSGAWYRVHRFGDLPEHAVKQISGLAQDSKGVKVKFSKPTKRMVAQATSLGLLSIRRDLHTRHPDCG